MGCSYQTSVTIAGQLILLISCYLFQSVSFLMLYKFKSFQNRCITDFIWDFYNKVNEIKQALLMKYISLLGKKLF